MVITNVPLALLLVFTQRRSCPAVLLNLPDVSLVRQRFPIWLHWGGAARGGSRLLPQFDDMALGHLPFHLGSLLPKPECILLARFLPPSVKIQNCT